MKPWTSFEHLICMSNYCTSYSQNVASLLLTFNTLSAGKGVLERYFVKRFYSLEKTYDGVCQSKLEVTNASED